MGKIRVVVDSAADFPSPSLVGRYHITLVPHWLQIGSESFRDREDITAEKFMEYLTPEHPKPSVQAPSVEQFIEVYTRLSKTTDRIISLHSTRALSEAWENAKTASQALLGRCNITVIDSQTTSVGLGLLAEVTAQTAERLDNYDEIVRQVRSAIGRIYSIFYVDTLDYLQRNGLISEAQTILGTMLGIKPFLTIEEGRLMTMEKVRTRSQAIDKLVEFVTEFGAIEKLVILQNSPYTTEAVRMLQDRLAAEINRRNFPTTIYGAVLASLLGRDATGVVVLERVYQEEDDWL